LANSQWSWHIGLEFVVATNVAAALHLKVASQSKAGLKYAPWQRLDVHQKEYISEGKLRKGAADVAM
tara:strand:+ start:43 stop:243 length:201 start_codon:yes stop_codon:yes gene_type:complete